MNTNISGNLDVTGDKRQQQQQQQPETTQTSQHNLTTIQNVYRIQTIQNIVQNSVQTIQPTQSIVSTVPSAIVGKSISLDLNPKLSIVKSVVQSGTASSVETSKITTTPCSVGSTVRIISTGMQSTVDRQNNSPGQVQQIQGVQQVVTTIPATYHVPRGPAAVASISAPRSTVATPIVRAASGQTVVPIVRPGAPTTIPTTQWPAKTTSVVYAPPQRHPVPPVSRLTTRPPGVYSTQPQLVAQSQSRPVQATVVTATVAGTPTRLLTPVLQSNNTITRIPVPQVRPAGPLVATTTVQPVRHQPQTIQTTQPPRTIAVPVTTNRVTVTAPVVGTANRIPGTASLTVQPTLGRQLSINPTSGQASANFSRVVIPSQQVQQAPGHQQGARVVQTITSLANIGTVSRVIATTATAAANIPNISRVTPSAPTSVARITGMTLHSLPLATPRTTPAPIKPIQGQTITQTVQIKSSGQQTLRVTPANVAPVAITSTTTIVTGTTTSTPTATIIINNSNTISNSPNQYSQYRQSGVQPVRLLVAEPAHEDNHSKPNASPRPSILRKRDYDSSPAKSAAKNLVPVLTSLASRQSSNIPSPPSSPRNDRDGGNQSSGSTTVSATSSPGLDEESEQSRINVQSNVMEMSPRKKPRKQQLTGVELTEARCNEEEMQFICDDKVKREIKKEGREKYGDDRGQNLGDGAGNQTVVVRSRPTPSLIGKDTCWKNRWGGRLHHYRRPGDVRPKEERRPTVAEIAQQKYVLQKINGWKVYQLTAQMEDLAELEKQVHEKLKSTLLMLESQQPTKNRQDDGLERANELIKGNMQRSSLISEGMSEARTQLIAIFQHKDHVSDILQRCGNKRSQKKRDK